MSPARSCFSVLLTALFIASNLTAEESTFRFAGIFTDHAVLQREQPIPVWGFAKPDAAVTVRFAGQEITDTANESGKWRVDLQPAPASSEPHELTATTGEESISLKGILVGEVWLCSGQSNMAMIVDRAKDPDKEKAEADLPGLRVFQVDRKAAQEPVADLSGEWAVSSPETVGQFSATAFFFGREIHRETNVPVGLIVSAWSGSAIEAWTSLPVQRKEPALKPLLESWAQKDAAWTPEVAAQEQAAYEKQLAEWRSLRDAAVKAGEERPRPPQRPRDPRLHHHHPAVLYNGMIAPLIPYGIRGAIWYQGETNGMTSEAASLYETQLPLLVNNWRRRWGQDFPMAWVQLPTISANRVDWAPVREAMRLAHEKLPNTGMAVTLDLGEERLLHPLNKQAFAHRLALWARATVYGESDLAWSGPLAKSMRLEPEKAIVTFDHATGGLAAKDGTSLTGFELVQQDGNWIPATARVDGDSVVVSAEGLTNPIGVRYAWGNHPEGTLVNGAGLPASPFVMGGETKTAPAKEIAPAPEPKRVTSPPPTKPPLDPIEITKLPEGMERLDLYLLMGQSNMKGRGNMPDEPLRDPQIVMMHKGTDKWFLARHPLHLTGDPVTFEGHDNAGVGPGLAFGQALAQANPDTRIGLIPCAVGGTRIGLWQPGARRFEDTIRRARLALDSGPKGKTRIMGTIWLQGEADSRADRVGEYADALNTMIDGLRKELEEPDLPFVASTILELREDIELRKSINEILLSLPTRRDHTACVDARDLNGHIGDMVHIDTPSQDEIGRRMAAQMVKLQTNKP